MKRFLSVVLIALLTAVSFTACGGSGDGNEDKKAEGKKIVINLSHVEPEDRSLHHGALKFKEYVEEKSNGVFEVNILSNSQYGSDNDSFQGVASGAIQMTACVTSALVSVSDDWAILDLPFIWDSRDAFYYGLDNEVGSLLNEKAAEYGVVGLGFNDNGLRQMTNNIRPIASLADFKGLKMRTMESPVFIDMFKLLGANPIPMSFSEVYTACQQGTIDGEEQPPALAYASKFHEVQKYLSITSHVYSANAIVANADWFNGLDEEQQQIIRDGVKIGLVDYQREMEGSNDEMFIEKMKEEGPMEVNYLTDEALAEIRKAVSPMYDEYGKTIDKQIFEAVTLANEKTKTTE